MTDNRTLAGHSTDEVGKLTFQIPDDVGLRQQQQFDDESSETVPQPASSAQAASSSGEPTSDALSAQGLGRDEIPPSSIGDSREVTPKKRKVAAPTDATDTSVDSPATSAEQSTWEWPPLSCGPNISIVHETSQPPFAPPLHTTPRNQPNRTRACSEGPWQPDHIRRPDLQWKFLDTADLAAKTFAKRRHKQQAMKGVLGFEEMSDAHIDYVDQMRQLHDEHLEKLEAMNQEFLYKMEELNDRYCDQMETLKDIGSELQTDDEEDFNRPWNAQRFS